MRFILAFIYFQILVMCPLVHAELTIPPKDVERQFLNRSEWLLDPSFEQGTGVTSSEASTVTYQTAWGANTVVGRSISWNPSVSGTLTFKNYKQSNGTEFTVEANRSGSLRGSCLVNGNDSTHTYTIQLYDATNAAVVKSENVIIGDSSTWNFQKVQLNIYPTADTKYVLRLSATANEAVIYVDECTLGFEEGVAPVNVSQVYSAKISSADAVTHENADWINGNCTDADAGEQTCTFTTGFFTQAPNCTISAEAAIRIATIISTSATAITIRTNTDAGAASDAATEIICQRSEPNSGFAVRMDQTNYDWTAYTPTFTGFGTATNIDFKQKREGSDLLIQGRFTSGTTTSTEARISLPSGLTSASSSVLPATLSYAGIANVAQQSTTFFGVSALIEPSVAYLTFGRQASTVSATSKQNASDIFSSSVVIFVTARVPIAGWVSNQSAPLIIGGVTSSYNGTMRTEVAKLNCDSGSAITLQYGSWISSIGNVSSRQCAITVASGIFSAAPVCTIAETQTGVTNNNIVGIYETSATSLTLDCDGHDASDCTAYDVNISCTGPR